MNKKKEEILLEIEQYLAEGFNKETINSVIRAKYNEPVESINELIEKKLTESNGVSEENFIKESNLPTDTFQGIYNENRGKQNKDNVSKKKQNIFKGTFTFLFIVALVILLSVYISNNYKKAKNIVILEQEIPSFTKLANNAVYKIQSGSSEIKDGFNEYLDRISKYSKSKPDIDNVLKPYLYSAERSWAVAEADMEVMFGIMKKIKEIIKPSDYEKFANLYSAIAEYKQGVSPYGKSASDYKKYTTESEIKMTREITIFSTYIGDYEDLLK